MSMRKFTTLLLCFLSVVMFGPSVQASTDYEKEVDRLSLSMAKRIVKAGKSKVAVVDFTDIDGNSTALGKFIAEEFSIALASAGKGFRVIDRTHLKSILKEHKLAQKGFIDPATARKLGKITGVEALVTGTMTAFGDTVRLSIKILDAETAEIIDANRGNIAKTQAIEELLARNIESVVSAGGTTRSSRSQKPKMKGITGKTTQTVKVNDFTFRLLECKRSGNTVECGVLITSNGKDKSLTIYGYYNRDYFSRVFDDSGNVYQATKTILGSKNSTSYVSSILPSGIPTKAVLHFKDIPDSGGLISMIDIASASGASFTRFKVQFRNIKISNLRYEESQNNSICCYFFG